MPSSEVISVKVWLTCTVTSPGTSGRPAAPSVTVTVASASGSVSSGCPAGSWVRKSRHYADIGIMLRTFAL
jgi:hypothetical protein